VWTVFILAFAGVWTLQIVMAHVQARHYRATLHEMRNTTHAGYLGVGVHKPRWGVGSVVILVTNQERVVLKAAHMTGVTVFARFKPMTALVGKPLETLQKKGDKPLDKATIMAVERIEEQVNRKEGDEDDTEGRATLNAGEQAV
jgi:glucitol operon activator protein